MAARTPTVVLEPAAQRLVDATSTPPFLYELEPSAARKVLDDLQAAPIDKLPIDEAWITVPASVGAVRVRIVKPRGTTGTLPVVVYMHGGGWVLGNAATHDRLVRELAVGARAAVAFVEYIPSPSSRATQPRSGSFAKVPPEGWMPAAWQSPVSRSAATWRLGWHSLPSSEETSSLRSSRCITRLRTPP